MLSDVTMAPDDLLPVQREAVTFAGDALVVIGAAGTGKTRVLAERFRWLVNRGRRPESLRVLAPSEGPADALRGWPEPRPGPGYDGPVVTTPVPLATPDLSEPTGGLHTPPSAPGTRP